MSFEAKPDIMVWNLCESSPQLFEVAIVIFMLTARKLVVSAAVGAGAQIICLQVMNCASKPHRNTSQTLKEVMG